MLYAVRLSTSAERQLARLEKTDQRRIVNALSRLENEPHFRPGVKQLTGVEGYRLRVGDFRVLYEIREHEVVVLVVKIGHRREVYR
jgi:mRNA interferase RelE/StbE